MQDVDQDPSGIKVMAKAIAYDVWGWDYSSMGVVLTLLTQFFVALAIIAGLFDVY